jgi:hypothetical protein
LPAVEAEQPVDQNNGRTQPREHGCFSSVSVYILGRRSGDALSEPAARARGSLLALRAQAAVAGRTAL